MIEIIKPNTKIDFVSKFNTCFLISALLILISLVMFSWKGLNYGVDFRGGAEIQVKFAQAIDLNKLRDALSAGGFSGATVQSLGEESNHEYLIKVLADGSNLNTTVERMTKSLQGAFSKEGLEIRKTDVVGPKAGEELRWSGIKALIYAVMAIMIYIGLRFDFRYAPGAVTALIHDVLMVVLVWFVLDLEFTLQIVAALLTIIGYSVNDTVVIYDRVREHEERNPQIPLSQHINIATNETLSRTIITAGATLFVAFSMFLWGGPSIRDFFFAISLGIIFGCYSTVFIAAPVTLFFDRLYRQRRVQSGTTVTTIGGSSSPSL